MVQDRLNALLRAAALFCLIPVAAAAGETPGWHGGKGEGGASLFYGIPQSGHAPLSFSCPQGGGDLVFTFAFEPVDTAEGAEVEVLLQAGDIEVPIVTTGMRIEMDDGFILEGRTVLDQRLADLLASRGPLLVFVEDGAQEFPLDGAREAAGALIETCAGKAAGLSSGTATCDLAAWIMKDAPAGLAVRAGPGPDYPAMATVPGPYSDGEETYFPQVRITGSRNGWFRIAEIITDLHGGLSTDPITTFSGEGWLPGNVLRLWVESAHLWSRPSPDAAIAFTFDAGSGSGDGDFRVDTLHACDGFWVEVEGRHDGRRPRGWTSDVCASQVTTCP